MKKMIRTTAAMLATGMLLTGCKYGWGSDRPDGRVTGDPREPAVSSAPVSDDDHKSGDRTGMNIADIADATYDQATQNSYLEFALSFYSRCADDSDADMNMMVSPASVLFALGMTSAGAGGDTLDQMVSTMTPRQDAYSLHAFAGDYNRRLNDSDDITLRSANSIWINENSSATVYSDFMDYVTGTYDAQINSIAFDTNGIDTMNNWVDEATDGMIDQIVPQDLDPTSLMVLINAIAFEADWSDGFTDDMIFDGTFRNSDGTTSDVSMLHEGEGSSYFETDFATGFARYYGDNCDYYFLAMLPTDETMNANEFAASLTAEDYNAFLNSRTNDYNVIYEIPEFECDYDLELNDVLYDMGIVDAFSDGDADFSNMTDASVFISRVLHKTHIEVDRNGTRAAAATAVFVDENCAIGMDNDRCVILDRPFAYAIVEASTGLPLFVGTVNSL